MRIQLDGVQDQKERHTSAVSWTSRLPLTSHKVNPCEKRDIRPTVVLGGLFDVVSWAGIVLKIDHSRELVKHIPDRGVERFARDSVAPILRKENRDLEGFLSRLIDG